MPIYDYKCQECGGVSEIIIRGTEGQAVRCPSCGSSRMERLISSSYVIKTGAQAPGRTCCGRDQRCETPPCASGDACRRG